MAQIIQKASGENVVQIALRVPVDVREWFRKHAALQGQSLNTAVNIALREKMAAEQATAQK